MLPPNIESPTLAGPLREEVARRMGRALEGLAAAVKEGKGRFARLRRVWCVEGFLSSWDRKGHGDYGDWCYRSAAQAFEDTGVDFGRESCRWDKDGSEGSEGDEGLTWDEYEDVGGYLWGDEWHDYGDI